MSPNKWLFFPEQGVSASVKLELDFTLVASGDNWNGTSPTWSGTDAGSPDNYALNTYTLKQVNSGLQVRLAFGGSGSYSTNGGWITANGLTLNLAACSLTLQDGTPHCFSTVAVTGSSSSTNTYIQFRFVGDNSWSQGLVNGDTCNLKLDW